MFNVQLVETVIPIITEQTLKKAQTTETHFN